jgi:hypothetical protein
VSIIDPSGLFNGDRLRRCSNAAQLHWPRLFLASDGFGRMEINYARIVGKAYPTFNPIPSETELQSFIQEYVNNYLLFPYEFAGQFWGQWDTRPELLPRYRTATDRRSPSPPEPAFTQWKQSYREERKAFPKSFGNIPAGFLHGVGIGIGIGEDLSCPSGNGRRDTSNRLPTLDELPFDTLDGVPAELPKTPAKNKSKKKNDEPWLQDAAFMEFHKEFFIEYPRRDKKKAASKILWGIYGGHGIEFLRETILSAVPRQKNPGGRLNPTNGPGFIPLAGSWLSGAEWENEEPGESRSHVRRLLA